MHKYSQIPPHIDVVVLGSVNQDEFLYVDALPKAGETTLARSSSIGLGGKGANQAAAAARLGSSVLFIGQVGSDEAGAFVTDELRRLGILTRLVEPVATAATGRAVICVDEQGENSIVVLPGANAALTAANVSGLLVERSIAPALTTTSIYLAQGETTAEATEAFARLAALSSSRFVLNLAPVIDLATDVVAGADPLVLNEGEARKLTKSVIPEGTEGGDVKTAIQLATWMARGHAKSVVITLGGEGAVASTGDQTWHEPSPDPGEVVDTTGAGDCFVGALTGALASGHTLRDAVMEGVAAGSLSVRAHGTTDSFPFRSDLDETLLAESRKHRAEREQA